MYYLLTYRTAPDYYRLRLPFREAHLSHVRAYHQKGLIVMAGALEPPAERAVIVFHCKDEAPIQAFIKEDPYVQNGLILSHEIHSWNVVIGHQK
ncbi:YciI family protein [Echinicola rosea]|uniref:YciI family protein n=1 Tax=Echinicola rosea TaxID=1807691 RepID=UPI0016513482|nr:YciI family protein [Echinicola rosea]